MSAWKVVRVFRVQVESFEASEEGSWCSNFCVLDIIAENAEEACSSAKRILKAEYKQLRLRPEEVTLLSFGTYCPISA